MVKKEILRELIIERVDRFGFVSVDRDCIISEERVDFYLNGEKLISVMSIAQDQDAHIVGFLMSEGVIESIEDIRSLRVSDDGLAVFVEAKINEANIQNLFKEKTLTTGCCVGVTGNIEDRIVKEFNKTKHKYDISKLFDNIELFYNDSELFKKSGCVHKAKLILADGDSIEAEDIGRHNAIDKTIGKARLGQKNTNDAYMIVSGRLSMEMVVKCVMHKIPMVISKAAPTALGIKTAQLHGVTLIGFARGGKMNIYTHSSRIKMKRVIVAAKSTNLGDVTAVG
jgi:FdhD protein